MSPSVNLGPPHISESIIAKKLKFYTEMIIFPPGDVRGAQLPRRKFGTPRISEIIGSRKLKFYIHLDSARYSFYLENG